MPSPAVWNFVAIDIACAGVHVNPHKFVGPPNVIVPVFCHCGTTAFDDRFELLPEPAYATVITLVESSQPDAPPVHVIIIPFTVALDGTVKL